MCPPAFGIAVAISALVRNAGTIRIPASRYESRRAGPTFANAIPGSTKSPDDIIAPEAIQKISRRVSSLFTVLLKQKANHESTRINRITRII